MRAQSPPDRATVIAVLAAYDGRAPEQVGERIDSLELAWLVHELQSSHALRHEFADAELVAMGTIDGAVAVLREVWAAEPAESQ